MKRTIIIATLVAIAAYGCVAAYATNTFLRDDATFASPVGIPGIGNVSGPGSSTVNDFALWNNTSGTLLLDATPTTATSLLNIFTSSLKGLAPASGGGTTNFLRADGTWAAPPLSGLVQANTYTTSQTITIPTGATKAFIRMVGGGGGADLNSSSGGVAAGGGGYLEKTLTALTPGNTLSLTIGAGGTTSGGNGQNTILSSGTQTITTLTASGGAGSGVFSNAAPFLGAGGGATNGDVNITGESGFGTVSANGFLMGGSSILGKGGMSTQTAATTVNSAAGQNYGGGASSSVNGSTAAGAQGVCIILWFS